MTQAEVAERINVGRAQISRIERGDLESTRIGTVRGYLDAIGGELAVMYVADDVRVQVA